jgi:quinol-cytochrome oxidoreductase complex cytochrome b subunit
MAPQAMTYQQRALPAGTQGAFVTLTTGLGSHNMAQAATAGKHPIGAWKAVEMSIGVGIFLMVLSAILAFAVKVTTPHQRPSGSSFCSPA